jgi:hypothetical protein
MAKVKKPVSFQTEWLIPEKKQIAFVPAASYLNSYFFQMILHKYL